MNDTPPLPAQHRFGRAVAAHLQAGAEALPHDLAERLRAARERAVAQRARALALPPRASWWRGGRAAGGAAAHQADGKGSGDTRLAWWGRAATALSVLALVAGLAAIQALQEERRATELAEVDAALLTDDLPPQAYADPAFLQFLLKNDVE